MHKIKEILVATNNEGKYREICDLLPQDIKIHSPKKLKIDSPEEVGESFIENSILKAEYFSKKSKLVSLSDDSGLEIDILNGNPGIHSARWSGKEKNFDIAIKRVFKEMTESKRNWKHDNSAKFVCCLTLFWPDGKCFSSRGEIDGIISTEKKGSNGFGYDPIFIPNGYKKTFGEMKPKDKISIDHRFEAFKQIKKFFT